MNMFYPYVLLNKNCGAATRKTCATGIKHLRLYGLRDRTDLIDLEEQAVAGPFLYGPLYAFWVCHCQVVPDYLNTHSGGKLRPGRPVVLVKGVLNRDD